MKAAILVLLALVTGTFGGAAIAVLILRQQPPAAPSPPSVAVESQAAHAWAHAPTAPDETDLAELRKSVSALNQQLARIEEQLASTNRDVLRHSLHLDALHNPISPLQSRGTTGDRFVPLPQSPLIPLGLGVTPRDSSRGPVWDTSGQPAPMQEEGEENELPLPQW